MANGVWHTGYGMEINLDKDDLQCPGYDYDTLLAEIMVPVRERDRMLLQCIQHKDTGYCPAEGDNRLPWMSISRRTIGGKTRLVASHLPMRTAPTPEESDKHKAMKDRLARAAGRHGLEAEQEVSATDRRIRTDVLVRGSRVTVGWEAQYSPITADTVRKRARIAVEHGITPMWLTNTPDAALINRAPWVRVDDLHWKVIASERELFVRGGVRHLQRWKCTAASQRQCPAGGSLAGCGRFHVQWFPPALCLPQQPEPRVDDMVVSTADGTFVTLQIPQQRDSRSTSWMWVSSRDQEVWYSIVGGSMETPDEQTESSEELTFSGHEIDRTCHYGEETKVFNDTRPQRDTLDGSGLHTFDEAPVGLYVVPEEVAYLRFNERERHETAAALGCPVYEIGPCAGCGKAIRRYGAFAPHACIDCRRRVVMAG